MFLVPVVFFSRNGVFGSREGLVVPRVFSVPGLGCFQFPDSGLMFPGMVCWAPVGVFSSRDGVSGSRPEGTAWRCLWFPYGVSGSRACSSPSSLLLLASSCFSAFLCFLPSFLPPFLISSASALLPVFLLSCPPFLPSPFLPCLLLPFL